MPFIVLVVLLFASSATWAATQYVCSSSSGSGDGSSLANCKAAGTNFASITVGAGDVIRICDTIRGTLTVTSTNNVTVDLDCNDEAAGVISGANVVTSFAAVDENGEYATTDTFAVPVFVIVNGVVWREGVKGSLADNEWAFNSASGGTHEVYLGSDPTGKTVEIAIRGAGIEFITSTGANVTGGRIYGIRHTGSATGNAGVIFRASSGTVEGTSFYAVRRPTDVTGNGSMTVQNTSTRYCVDGPDANKNTDRPTLIAISNTVEDCDYADWFENTSASHSLTLDGEGIACTDCAVFTAYGNTVKRTHHGFATRVDSSITQIIERNWIEDTNDEGLNIGCTNSSGVINLRASGNILRETGKGGGWATSSFGVAVNNSTCGNGSVITVANNDFFETSNGIFFQAAASQTGTISVYNNAIVNVNPEQTAGTHYFITWNSINASHSMTLLADDNDYYQIDGVGFFRWISGSSARAYSAFSSYQSDSSVDANSIQSDPLFVGGTSSSTATGFRLSPSSPLISAGTYVGNYTDYSGMKFNNLKPSIGAYETTRRVTSGLSNRTAGSMTTR